MTDVSTRHVISAADVMICDERSAARRELRLQLTLGAAQSRVTDVGDAAGLIEEFGASPTGVVMIGVHRGSHVGAAALNLILDRHPTAHVIVYGAVQDSALLAAALAAGARGLMIWDIGQRLNLPLPQSGNPHGPGSGAGTRRPAPPLTEREIQILHGMSNGKPNSAIGRELFISEDTVKTHARRLFNKIGALDRAHAVALGLRAGIL